MIISNKSPIFVVTGGTSGIGKATVHKLASMQKQVVIACRNIDKGKRFKEILAKSTNNSFIDVIQLDLSSFSSISQFVKDYTNKYVRLDVLINNAGIYQPKRELSENGYEKVFATNYLGHFLLTNLLLHVIINTPNSRIINVSSDDHKKGTIKLGNLDYAVGWQAYANSKLANVIFTNTLADKLKGTSTTVYSLHPGVMKTNFGTSAWWFRLMYSLFGFFMKKPDFGAKRIIYLAISKDVQSLSGEYFEEKICQPSDKVHDKNLQEGLWEKSLEIVGMRNKSTYSSSSVF